MNDYEVVFKARNEASGRYNELVGDIKRGSKDIDASNKQTERSFERTGRTLKSFYKEQRSEDRMMKYYFREARGVIGLAAIGLSVWGAASKEATSEQKKLNDALSKGFETFVGLEFVLSAAGAGPWGLAAAGVMGVVVALMALNDEGEKAKKLKDLNRQMFELQAKGGWKTLGEQQEYARNKIDALTKELGKLKEGTVDYKEKELELETATQALWEINKKIVDLMTTAGDSTRNLGVQMDILTKRLEKLSPSSKDYLKTLLEIKEVQDKLNNLEQRHEYILSGTQKRIDNITSGIKAGKYDAHGGLQGPKKDKFGRIISGEVEGYKFTESDKAMEKAAIADAVQQGAWIEEYINKLDQLKLTAKTVADDILGFMQDMSGGITDALFGETVNWGSIFKNFLKSLVQQGIMTLFSSLFGGGLMNLAGSNSLFGGLVAPKQHSGGLMGDERVVVVQAGERILNRREAKDYQKGRNGGSVTIQNVNVYQAKYRSKLEARAAVADIIDDMLEKGKF